MKKVLKIIIILSLLYLFLLTSVNAFSIDMNLGDMTPTDVEGIVEEALDENLEIDVDSSETDDSSPRVTTKNTSDDEFLTVENILSIVIIVIGLLLIFLAIAILIRLR